MAFGYPMGDDLCSVTVNTSSLPELWEAYATTIEFVFDSSYDLVNGNTYAIVVQTTGVSPTYPVAWGQHTSDNYAGGTRCYSFDDGDTWTLYPTRDNWFETKANDTTKDANNDAVSSVLSIPSITQDIDIAAQTFTASSSYTITSVVLILFRQTGHTAGTVTVSIKVAATPGKVTNPTPTDNQEDLLIAGTDQLKQLTWDAPEDETPDYLVYFRAQGGSWVLQETITDDSTTHTLSQAVLDVLDYYSIYEWRVDTRENEVTTTGDTWTFITQYPSSFTTYTRRSDYNANKVWQPGTGWVDIDSFEYTGGGRYKGRVLVIGHKCIYFGDL